MKWALRQLLLIVLISWGVTASSPRFTLTAEVEHGAERGAKSKYKQLERAARQGNGFAMLALARHYEQEHQSSLALLWAQRALAQGQLEALSLLLEWYPQNARQWYSKLAEQGEVNAQIYIWHQQALSATFNSEHLLLEQLADIFWPTAQGQLTAQSREQLAELTLVLGVPHHLPHWRALAPDTDYWRHLTSGDEVLRRGIQSQHIESCDFTLNFVIERPQGRKTMLTWLAALEGFLQGRGYRLCARHQEHLQFVEQCMPQQGRAFCEPQTILPKKANQKSNPSGNQGAEQLAPVVIYLTQQGAANTRNGQIYINEQASWRVLLHELGHALGLADEYPMQAKLAEQFCHGHYVFYARNLVFLEAQLYQQGKVMELIEHLPWQTALTTAIAQPVSIGAGVYYRLGSNEADAVGLYPATTCAATTVQAWKPFAQVTFMEQHDSGDVPELYLQWMAAAMRDRHF